MIEVINKFCPGCKSCTVLARGTFKDGAGCESPDVAVAPNDDVTRRRVGETEVVSGGLGSVVLLMSLTSLTDDGSNLDHPNPGTKHLLVLKGSQLLKIFERFFVFESITVSISHLDISFHYKQNDICSVWYISNCDEKLSSPSSSFCGIHLFHKRKSRDFSDSVDVLCHHSLPTS